MLGTATGNCAVTKVTYSENKCYVVKWTVYLESSMYLRRRQWLRQIVCYVPHCLLVPQRRRAKVCPISTLKLLLNQDQICFLINVLMQKWLIHTIWLFGFIWFFRFMKSIVFIITSHHQINLCPLLLVGLTKRQIQSCLEWESPYHSRPEWSWQERSLKCNSYYAKLHNPQNEASLLTTIKRNAWTSL